MKILLGVIKNPESEKLFILDEGHVKLIPAGDTDPLKEFKNYAILKNRSLKIKDEPISGAGVFKFRYGPVTAGIREAGSYILYTFGEKILRATIDLQWKHRRMEKAMENKTIKQALSLSEGICSNFAVSHSIAFSRAVESALQFPTNLQTRNWRNLLLEMERVYNHLLVIYKLTSAAAQKVLTAHLSALFEEALRLNKCISGSRYLSGMNKVSGIDHFPDLSAIKKAIAGYQQIQSKFMELYRHSLNNPNYLDRLHSAGTLSSEKAMALGLTGPSLRASGVNDGLNGTTTEHFIGLQVVTQKEGDSLARMETRSEELVNSCQYIIDHLKVCDSWEEDEYQSENNHTEGEGCGVAHSPSGAVGYYVEIYKNTIKRMYAFTPSYAGMHAIADALTNYVFTDFPFITDSFGVHFTGAAR